MSADEFGRNGREWRFCAACQKPDALVWRKLVAGAAAVLQCRFCFPIKKPAPAPEGIFA